MLSKIVLFLNIISLIVSFICCIICLSITFTATISNNWFPGVSMYTLIGLAVVFATNVIVSVSGMGGVYVWDKRAKYAYLSGLAVVIVSSIVIISTDVAFSKTFQLLAFLLIPALDLLIGLFALLHITANRVETERLAQSSIATNRQPTNNAPAARESRIYMDGSEKPQASAPTPNLRPVTTVSSSSSSSSTRAPSSSREAAAETSLREDDDFSYDQHEPVSGNTRPSSPNTLMQLQEGNVSEVAIPNDTSKMYALRTNLTETDITARESRFLNDDGHESQHASYRTSMILRQAESGADNSYSVEQSSSNGNSSSQQQGRPKRFRQRFRNMLNLTK